MCINVQSRREKSFVVISTCINVQLCHAQPQRENNFVVMAVLRMRARWALGVQQISLSRKFDTQ